MFNKRDQVIILVLVAVVVAGLSVILVRDYRLKRSFESSSPVEILVSGETARPGTYRIKAGSTFRDIARLAGFSRKASGRISVDIAEPDASVYAQVNINSATAAQIESLPGIGPKLAKEIVSFRERRGPFIEKQQLMGVKGIGPAKYKKMAGLITVREKAEGRVPETLSLELEGSTVALACGIDSSLLLILSDKRFFSAADMVSKTQSADGLPVRLRMEVR